MPKGRVENLKLIKTTEEAREKGRAGGIASGKARRKKKFMASVYADMFCDKYDIQIDEEKKKTMDAEEFFKYVVTEILLNADRASVAQLKEMSEQVEKLDDEGTDNELRIVIDDEQESDDKEN